MYLLTFVLIFSDNFKIKPDQQEWIKNSINTVYELINNTPPDGFKFSEVVKNILQVHNFLIAFMFLWILVFNNQFC